MAANGNNRVDELAAAVRSGDRSVLARAITLVESGRPDRREQAQHLLQALMPDAGSAMHVGITGVPGVGKSTAIEALGMHLVEQGHRVAVLAVDPSSTKTGGSILGDKTRMARLAVHPDAYIRPSPTSGTLGGVAKATRCRASRRACSSSPMWWWSTRPTGRTPSRPRRRPASWRVRSGSSTPVKP